MPMPAKLHDLLTEKLGDEKYKLGDEEQKVVDILANWEDAASAKDKVQKANKEISDEREALKKEVGTLKDSLKEKDTALADKDKEIERHQQNALSDDDKAKLEALKGKGMTPEAEAKYNALEAKLNEAADNITKLTDTITQKEQLAEKATEASHREKLNTALLSALAEKGIKSPKNQKLAIAAINADGLAKISKAEDGTYKQAFIIRKDGKDLEATIDGLAEHFAGEHESLVDSSGNQGTGNNHDSGTGNHGYEWGKGTLDDARRHASELMSTPK